VLHEAPLNEGAKEKTQHQFSPQLAPAVTDCNQKDPVYKKQYQQLL
jgi:hypothetical protein